MKRIFHFRTIKSHIIIYFSLIFLFSIGLFGSIVYYSFQNTLTNEIKNYTTQIVDEARINLDSYFQQIGTLLQITAGNSIMFDALLNNSTDNYGDKLYYNRQIEELMQNTIKINSKIKDIIIINDKGFAYDYTGNSIQQDYNFYKQTWYPKDLNLYFKASFIGLHPQDYYLNPTEENDEVVSAVIPIMDFMTPGKKLYGSVIYNLKVNDIQELTKETRLEKTGFFLIMDSNNNIIYKPHDNGLLENQTDELMKQIKGESGNFIYSNGKSNFLAVFKTSKVTNWKIVASIPTNEIQEHINNIRTVTLVLALLCILSVIIAAIIITGRITRPIIRLMNGMERIEQGNFNEKLYDRSTEEIEALSSRMDLMINRINALNRDIYSYQVKSRDAAIKALQAQINPHFLYNTLQAIKAMAVNGKGLEISKMATLLGNLFRYAVYNSEELVSIKEEVNHVREYMELQSLRYPDKFDFRIECDDDILQYKTLKLILQPIVENSIMHGLNENPKGIIQIEIDKSDTQVRFQISDNGVGINDEEIIKITEYINNPEQKDDSHSIGLKNVHERIQLKYGKPYGIQISSQENLGTCVKVSIPIIL